MQISRSGLVILTLLAFTLPAHAGERSFQVSRESIGSKWPFHTIERGTVRCSPRNAGGRTVTSAIFEANGKRYALNGAASSRFGYPYPWEAGIVRRIPYDEVELEGEFYNASDYMLLKLCFS